MTRATPSQNWLGRLLAYGRRHGVRATASRFGLAVRRLRSGNRLRLFYCDLADYKRRLEWPIEARVERKNAEDELDGADLIEIVNVWNPEMGRRQIKERFGRGASLWLLKWNGKLAGYGWTMAGGTIAPHFFPLTPKDAHLFDFYVFPAYRGRRINPLLVESALEVLGAEQKTRAYIEAAEWNAAQLRSLGRTAFRSFGWARKFCVFGRTMVIWSGEPPKQGQPGPGAVSLTEAGAPGRSGEQKR